MTPDDKEFSAPSYALLNPYIWLGSVFFFAHFVLHVPVVQRADIGNSIQWINCYPAMQIKCNLTNTLYPLQRIASYPLDKV